MTIDIIKEKQYNEYIIEKSKPSESSGRKATILKEIPMDVGLPITKKNLRLLSVTREKFFIFKSVLPL